MVSKKRDRRDFIKKSAAFAAAGLSLSNPYESHAVTPSQDSDLFIVGPKSGFTPQVGTLVSMLNWTRKITTVYLGGLSVEDLDFLIYDNANSIGALVLHFLTQEKECQVQTFKWSREEVFTETYKLASKLGDETREKIKGNDLEFYLEELRSVRQKSIEELKNRDDEWLLEVDEDHPWGVPINNYCQWFHVLEHECQHAGQISLVKNRLPS